MMCPNCNSENTMCLDSRPTDNNTRKRRYKCNTCLSRFNTIELYKDTYDKQLRLANLTAELVKAGATYE